MRYNVCTPLKRKGQRTQNKPLHAIHSVDDLPVVCTAAEAGLLLRLTPEQVRKLAREGALRGAKQGQAWYFRRDDLIGYMDRIFGGGETGE